jgi:hypothetical protein
MINRLGGIRQLAMVVRDADRTMHYLTEALGIGPFFVTRNYVPDDFRYRGHAAPAPVLTLCFAQAGPVQIELIQQHNAADSAYQEFLSAGREGCQHIAVWFSDSAAYTAARREILESGLTLVHENGDAAAYARFAYFETKLPGGLMLEIAEALTPKVRDMFERVARESIDWDRSDPVRMFD